MSEAKTFVYVSNAQDGNIDAYVMDMSTGALASVGKAEAGKLVMPMAISPSKKHLYAVVRSQPVRVLTFAIDPATGRFRRKHRRHCPTACLMCRPTRRGGFFSRPLMVSTRLR
jgi:6-phosphogluconolactonase